MGKGKERIEDGMKDQSPTHQEIADKLTIEVIGPGCSYCRDLFRRTCDVVAEQNMDVEPLHVTDLMTVLRYIPFTPVLRVNGRIVHRGKDLPDKGRLWSLIRAAAGPEKT